MLISALSIIAGGEKRKKTNIFQLKMDKYILIYPHNRLLFSNKKGSIDTYMDEP